MSTSEQTSASRQPGYYWVNSDFKKEFRPRYWNGNLWFVGMDVYVGDEFWQEIDERRIERPSPQQQPDTFVQDKTKIVSGPLGPTYATKLVKGQPDELWTVAEYTDHHGQWRVFNNTDQKQSHYFDEIGERIEQPSPQQQPDVCPTCGNLKPDGKYCSNSFHLMPDELSKAQARIRELENETNSLKINLSATKKLLELHDFASKETAIIAKVIVQYYYVEFMQNAGLQFLQDAARYASLRNPAMTEGQTWFQLCADWANKVEFDKHRRL